MARNEGVVVGSLWNEESDAAQFAGWGVDALHYDNCGQDIMDGGPGPPGVFKRAWRFSQ